MKYLINHKKEFVITVVALIVAVCDFLKVFGINMPIDENSVYAVVSAIMGVLVWFYNMPTSYEGDIAKIELKELKAQRLNLDDIIDEPADSEVL